MKNKAKIIDYTKIEFGNKQIYETEYCIVDLKENDRYLVWQERGCILASGFAGFGIYLDGHRVNAYNKSKDVTKMIYSIEDEKKPEIHYGIKLYEIVKNVCRFNVCNKSYHNPEIKKKKANLDEMMWD